MFYQGRIRLPKLKAALFFNLCKGFAKKGDAGKNRAVKIPQFTGSKWNKLLGNAMIDKTLKTAAVLTLGLATTIIASAENPEGGVTNAPGSEVNLTKSPTEKGKFKPKEGFFIGVQWVNNSMSGDFDDSSYLQSPSTIYDVPDVDSGKGFGIAIGAKTEVGSVELSYQRTTHETSSSFFGDSEADYNVVEMNLKFDLIKRYRLRPYIQFGFGVPWLTIENSAQSGSSPFDETFVGFDLNAGAGLSYYLTERLALTGGVVYRWNWFMTVEGESIEESLLENTVNGTIGLSYTF